MNANFREMVARPFAGRVIWIGFAVLFFYSGMYFTEFVMAPGSFAGGWLWLWVAAFPVLLPLFFVVNRRYGCATGACRRGACELPAQGGKPEARKSVDGFSVKQMPGA